MSEASRIQVLANGQTVGYAEYGDPEGEVLFFHHGWPGSHPQARPLDAPARLAGIRVIAPDRPGIGDSSPGGADTVYDYAETVRHLADHLDIDRFHVMGVSGGGPYTLACAARFPHRVRGVGVCCGAPPLWLAKETQELHIMYRTLLTLDRGLPLLIDPLLHLFRSFFRIAPASVGLKPLTTLLPRPDKEALCRPENRQMLHESIREAFRNGTEAIVRDARRIQGPWGFDLESIEPLVIFWHGTMDRNIPIEMARSLMIQRVPRAITHVYPGDGHYSLPMTRAGQFLEHLILSQERGRRQLSPANAHTPTDDIHE